MPALRRSPRLKTAVVVDLPDPALVPVSENTPSSPLRKPSPKKLTKRAASKTSSTTEKEKGSKPSKKKKPRTTTEKSESTRDCLPRTLEQSIIQDAKHPIQVLGIDEAGRGPLAGPVVAAAAICPTDVPGVVDSKLITQEEQREELYKALMALPDIQYAVCVVDAPTIDRINILQATLLAMRTAATALVAPHQLSEIPLVSEPSIQHPGSYVFSNAAPVPAPPAKSATEGDGASDDKKDIGTVISSSFHALIDGNKVPKDMPCPAQCVIKGDGKEYSIAAASILCKVTRDRLMHDYHALYPQYGLDQHKGYPTLAHRQAVTEIGCTPIHRRTFAPLKTMHFDEHGKIIPAHLVPKEEPKPDAKGKKAATKRKSTAKTSKKK
eukprot:Nitzschia sp. Nitz4//scaffold154_size52827//10003//11145//NITZ4_006772-RA/size52827-processed-gene-0.82-mRNA-1//-1//CDS//3329537296//7625//frame0